jgi:predicted MFS family arabinose efflux permease
MLVVMILWTAFFVINFNVAMMIPLLPFIQRDIGLSSSQAAMVLAAFPVVALMSNLALGPFIDRIGRKKFIVTGGAGCAIVLAATALSTSALPIIVGRAITGLFMPMIGASVFAAVADYIPAQNRTRVTGYVTTAAPFAFLLAMSIGVFLGGLVAWQLPLIVLAVVCLLLAIGASMLPPTNPAALAMGPVTRRTYRDRLLSLSLDANTRLLLPSYFCWAAAVVTFMGLYPSWVIQHGLATHSVGMIGTMLLLGEIGGLFGAFLSGRLSLLFRHPLGLCATAAIGIAVVVLIIPFGTGLPLFQAIAYGAFAFGRDLMMALMLGGAMLLVGVAQRGSLNAILNALYQTGAAVGGMASAWLYAFRTDFMANSVVAAALLALSGFMLWNITRIKTPVTADI